MGVLGLYLCLLCLYIGVLPGPACAACNLENEDAIPPTPDYSRNSSWVAKADTTDKPVDVFYIYPTIYPERSPKNMDIYRPDLRARAEHLILAQAGAFSSSANLFAPYYRQVSFAVLDPDVDMVMHPNFRIGAEDAYRAFDFYLANLNPDRPFILASDSQGTIVMLDILRRRFYDKSLQKRLVAAYLIGYSVTAQDLKKHPWLKIAQHADDTCVIITFNTQAPGATGSPVLLPGASCVNPLSWTTGNAPADKFLNLGAVFFDENTNTIEREVPHYCGAQIDPETGALVTTPPDDLPLGNFPDGVYHKYDYAFWYRNLEQNAATRIEASLKK